MSKIDISNLTSSNISDLNTDESQQVVGGTFGKKCGFIGGFAGGRRGFKSLGCGVGVGSAVSISAPAIEVPAAPVIPAPIAVDTSTVSAIACADGNCEATTVSVPTH